MINDWIFYSKTKLVEKQLNIVFFYPKQKLLNTCLVWRLLSHIVSKFKSNSTIYAEVTSSSSFKYDTCPLWWDTLPNTLLRLLELKINSNPESILQCGTKHVKINLKPHHMIFWHDSGSSNMNPNMLWRWIPCSTLK